MDVDSFLGRSQASFRSWGVEAEEVCAFITEGDTQTDWGGGETTDRQTEGVRLDRESQRQKEKRSYRIPDAGEVM